MTGSSMQAVRHHNNASKDLPQAKSPPSAAKNLQHVPCRFYRSGQCTAGRNCVFSHDLQQETERAPCKYFQKGNCRFGAKCALAHILPDGRRVNHNHIARPQISPVFGRIVPENRSFQSSGIHDQLIQSQRQSIDSPPTDEFPALSQQLQQLRMTENGSDEQALYSQNVAEWQLSQQAQEDAQHKASRDLSRREDLFRSPVMSPPARTLGPLDAQLPASLDSNGISWFARHGPVAASVPHTSHFGIPEQFTSHPSSPHPTISVQPSTSLFTPNLGTSPRNTTLGRAMFERRVSHINDRTDDPDGTFEEDFVPSSLSELLTPAERQRRDSRGAEENVSKSPNSTSGSPSSSRFGLLFSKHKAAETALRNSPSQATIMPIGSPLARGSPNASGGNPLSPPRMQRNMSGLRTDMKASAKEFNGATSSPSPGKSNKEQDKALEAAEKEGDKEFHNKSEDEPFEMDI